MRYIAGLCAIVFCGILAGTFWLYQQKAAPTRYIPKETANFSDIRQYWAPRLDHAFQQANLTLGSPIYMRVFKQSSELELWVQDGNQYRLFKTYPICRFSGKLGPKLQEGDKQAPEGFYYVTAGAMKPDSTNHLAFNIGFPNRYDRAHDRTGSFLMVHGKCTSIGCYAMTDLGIEEIYTIADQALHGGQTYFRVHAFPFRMTADNMKKYQDHEWIDFWQNLKEGYDYFETHRQPPNIEVEGQRYVVASTPIT